MNTKTLDPDRTSIRIGSGIGSVLAKMLDPDQMNTYGSETLLESANGLSRDSISAYSRVEQIRII